MTLVTVIVLKYETTVGRFVCVQSWSISVFINFVQFGKKSKYLISCGTHVYADFTRHTTTRLMSISTHDPSHMVVIG